MNDRQGNPDRVSGFVLYEKLAEGGFGEVYRATDASPFEGSAAVKIISPHPFNESKDTEARFLRESEAVRRLNHGGIVRYQASGFTNDNPRLPFLAMDFIDGKSLREMAIQIPYERRIFSIIEVLEALEYAHSLGVLHRDIKPSNIMIRASDNKTILVDFGLAYVYEGISANTLTTHYIGSLGYIPLEVQVDPSIRTSQHDIFSCAVTLYEICAGNRPNIQIYRPLREISEHLVGLDPIIQTALAPAAQRHKSAGEFAEQLRSWVDTYSLRMSAGPNTISSQMRRRLIERQTRQAAQESIQQQEAQRLQQQWQPKHDIIITAARDAFRSAAAELADLMPNFSLSEAPYPSEKQIDADHGEILKYKDNSRNFSVIFALSNKIQAPMGPSGQNIPIMTWLPVQSRGPQGYRPNAFNVPAWIIYTEADSHIQYPCRLLYGGILLTDPDGKLLCRPIERHFSGIQPHQASAPDELTDFSEIRDYISQALASALHLDAEQQD